MIWTIRDGEEDDYTVDSGFEEIISKEKPILREAIASWLYGKDVGRDEWWTRTGKSLSETPITFSSIDSAIKHFISLGRNDEYIMWLLELNDPEQLYEFREKT